MVTMLILAAVAGWWLWPRVPPGVAERETATLPGTRSAVTGDQPSTVATGVAESVAVSAPGVAAGSRASISTAPGLSPAQASAAAKLPLPMTGLPLRESGPALLAAHRAGNIEATKRLMDELGDCMRYRRSSLNMDMAIAMQDGANADGRRGRGGDGMARWLSQAAATVAGLRESCESLPDDFDQEMLFEVQRRAADVGDLEGLLGFSLIPAISMNKALLQMDRLEIYREFAPQFLQRALEQGSGQAVAGFMQGYEHYFEGWRGRAGQGTAMQTQAMRRMMESVNPQTPIQQVLGEDLGLAYRYALLCKRVCNAQDRSLADASILRLESALEPDIRSAARDRSNTLYDRHFAAKPRPEDIDLEALREAIIGFGGGRR